MRDHGACARLGARSGLAFGRARAAKIRHFYCTGRARPRGEYEIAVGGEIPFSARCTLPAKWKKVSLPENSQPGVFCCQKIAVSLFSSAEMVRCDFVSLHSAVRGVRCFGLV